MDLVVLDRDLCGIEHLCEESGLDAHDSPQELGVDPVEPAKLCGCEAEELEAVGEDRYHHCLVDLQLPSL